MKKIDLAAKTIEFGFYYEFDRSPVDDQDMHILRVNQKTQEMKDFVWPLGANLLESMVSEQEWLKSPWLTTSEVVNTYADQWCLNHAHEWLEINEDFEIMVKCE